MKHKGMFYSAIVVLSLSVASLFFGLFVSKIYLMILGTVGSLMGVIFLTSAITYRKYWRCDKCKQTFPISIWEFTKSSNGRRNQKRLHCPNCKRNTWCSGTSE